MVDAMLHTSAVMHGLLWKRCDFSHMHSGLSRQMLCKSKPDKQHSPEVHPHRPLHQFALLAVTVDRWEMLPQIRMWPDMLSNTCFWHSS